MVHGKTFKEASTGKYIRSEHILFDSKDNTYKLKDSENSNSPVKITMNWEKMSKSKYNGVDPNQIIKLYGSDAARALILFKAPIEQALEWEDNAILGQTRWLRRVYRLVLNAISSMNYSEQTKVLINENQLSEIQKMTQDSIKEVNIKSHIILL
jgi:leucyl-tRNA synthetase